MDKSVVIDNKYQYYYQIVNKKDLIGKIVKTAVSYPVRAIYELSSDEDVKFLINLTGTDISDKSLVLRIKEATSRIIKKRSIALILSVFFGEIKLYHNQDSSTYGKNWCLILFEEKIYLLLLQDFDCIGPFE